MYKLVICEKPGQGNAYAAVLGANERRDGYCIGNNYIITWCFGHLLELAAPDAYDERYAKWCYADLPIVPDRWEHVAAKDKTSQLKILKNLMNRKDVETVINGCDAGREGELIFRLVYEYTKSRKPFKRLWISSMEDTAIRDGFSNLKDGTEYDNLYYAALCRSQADWIVGINATRLFTVVYNETLNTGRVQSPTLALLVKRELDIKNFIKEPFYIVELDCKAAASSDLAAGGCAAVSERFADKATAESITDGCTSAVVTSVTQTEKSIAPPELYDLTTLQREANRKYGFTAQQTLDYTQGLYEKKLVTYPRVDSRYLTDDMAEMVEELVRKFEPDAPCNASQVIDSRRVSDHHAIIPTTEAVKADVSVLAPGEHKILQLLKRRLICAVGEKHRYLETIAVLNSRNTEFTAKGKVVLNNGWRDYSDESDKYVMIPQITEGQTIPVTAQLKEGSTSPPKHYTEDTLLSAMENAGDEDKDGEMCVSERKGLGTPATRASTLERIIKAGFAERAKKNIVPTEKGISLISILPNELTSAKLTAEWEHKLHKIQYGELAANEFMANITAFIKAIIIGNNKPKANALFSNSKKAAKPLGKCPRCGGDISEGSKGFFCDNQSCEFKLWKASRFWMAKRKPLTAAIVKALLRDGRITLNDLFSERTGSKYKATVLLDDAGGKYVNYRIDFLQGV